MNKRYLFIVLSAVFIFSCAGKKSNWKWIDTLPKPWTLAESEVSEILPEFQKQFPNFEERINAFAIWRIGTPYEIFKLGEETPPDTDPIIRLDVSDCTGHILTTLAFVQSDSWQSARENLIQIHYKPDSMGNKIPTYKSRWHFTADRLLSNPNTVNITSDLLAPDDLTTINIELNRKDDGSEFLDLGWTRNVAVSYIPSEMINSALLEKLPEVCGIHFVRKKYFDLGIVIAHEGMVINQKELIHASSTAKETVRLDLLDYYFTKDGPLFDGIMISKFVPLD